MTLYTPFKVLLMGSCIFTYHFSEQLPITMSVLNIVHGLKFISFQQWLPLSQKKSLLGHEKYVVKIFKMAG